MTTIEIFQIIQRLTLAQRRNATQFIRGISKTPSDYYVLYQRIIEQKGLNEGKIRGEKFKGAVKYSKYKKELVEKILVSNVMNSNGNYSTRAIIEEAFRLNALDLIEEYFSRDFEKALARLDYHHLLNLLKIQREVWHQYHFSIPLRSEWPTSNEVLTIVKDQEKAHSLLQELRMLLPILEPEKQFRALRIERSIKELLKQSSLPLAGQLKLRIGLFLISRNYESAYAIQRKLTEELSANPYWKGRLLHESSFQVKLAVLLKNPSYVSESLTRLSAIKIEGIALEKVWKRLEITDTITAADAYHNLEWAMYGFEQLKECSNLFEPRRLHLLSYYCSQIAFWHAEFRKATQVLDFISAKIKAENAPLWVYTSILELMLSMENDDIDKIDRLIRSTRRKAERLDNPYAMFIVDTIEKISQSALSKIPEIMDAAILAIAKFRSQPIFNQDFNFLDFEIWLQAKREHRYYMEVISVRNSKLSGNWVVGF